MKILKMFKCDGLTKVFVAPANQGHLLKYKKKSFECDGFKNSLLHLLIKATCSDILLPACNNWPQIGKRGNT